MKNAIALAALALAATAAHAQTPTELLKGKVKPGLYAYKMEMDMGQVPGMPAGAGKQVMNMQHCVTPQDVERGELGKSDGARNCEMKDFKMTGSSASYKMVCKGEFSMVADNTIQFAPDGFKMAMRMQMDRGGQKMNFTQNMEAKLLGPCPAGGAPKK